MYEETKSSIDWKGIFLKVIIAFLIVLIAVKGYTTLKGNNNNQKTNTTTETITESKSSSTFTANIEKLRDAGEKYFKENTSKLPTEGNTTMITLNELIDAKVIDNLADEEGKNCDGESSYVTATKEGNKTKIKANLVCGDASSYSLVYMGENDSKTEEVEESKTTTNSTSTKTSTSKTTSTKKETTTSCGTSCGTPNVKVDTNVSQTVTINKPTTTTKQPTTKKPTTNSSTSTTNKKAVYYTVTFNSNGGDDEYSKQTIKENNTATNPGIVTLRGYRFLGWYLNGIKYDFSTPVTRNITLVARFVKNNYYYEDDYYYNDNYYDDYYYEDDYYYNDDYYFTGNKYYGNSKLYTGQYTTYVSSIVWDEKGTTKVNVNHTLRVPEHIENLDVEEVRIVKAEPTTALTNTNQIRTYRNNFRDTFIYKNNGWESDNILANHMAEININYADVDVESTRYKDIDDALEEGFDVEWSASRVKSQCRSTFTVNNQSFLCNYGIVYRVTWEYRYYR